MSSFMSCFCCFIFWQRSIIVAAVMVFPSVGSGDCAWTGEQMARAKAKARLERMAKVVFVWILMFCCLPYDVRDYPQQPPDLRSGLAPAGADRNFCRQWSLQK